jgi:hypothetical protein
VKAVGAIQIIQTCAAATHRKIAAKNTSSVRRVGRARGEPVGRLGSIATRGQRARRTGSPLEPDAYQTVYPPWMTRTAPVM